MTASTALVLDPEHRPPCDLLDVLVAECETVEITTPLALLSTLDSMTLPVDVLLASAKIPLETIRSVRDTAAGGGPAPSVVVYTERDFGSLERHVRFGYDYLVPPFLPGLVATRLRTCRERANLAREADLVELSSTERELQIGREIQQGFLPESMPATDGWDISVRFHPARQVAGDFYDIFDLVSSRRLALIVADVCDKGVGAALFMALIRSLLRYSAEHSGLQSLLISHRGIPMAGATPLMDAVSGTNDYLTRNHLRQAYFATMFFGVLDPATGKMLYVNGGHNPPLLMRAGGGAPEVLGPTGPAVGVLPGADFAMRDIELGVGDSLFVYTDGVTEARDISGGFLGNARLQEALTAPAGSADELVGRVEELLRGHTGDAEQNDDITMLAIHRRR
ncbi:MAG TPA: PP2C family protein-serine/threonine phosphatase [Pseudonocardiaceae bacterium]|nr:PP2C family protein-serine/threonine phosphatase [Pseudonocardiaceae bacterium]